jgi:uncharacterized protein
MSKVPRWMWLDAESLVAQAMRDLAAGKAISIPSKRYAVLTRVSRLAPRRIVARMARMGR